MRRLLSACLALFFLWLFLLPAGASPRIVYRHAGGADHPRVALTFDDGPHPRYTPQILDILKEYGVPATFFAVGANAEAYPDLILREVNEGHEVGGHTYHHYRPVKLTGDTLYAEVISCDRALEHITGRRVRYFRPPEGVCSDLLNSACEEQGLTIVLWSVDTRDWAHTPVDAICANVRKNVKDGSIILMHDFIGQNSPTPAALRRIVPMLRESGYEFVTISDLLGAG